MWSSSAQACCSLYKRRAASPALTSILDMTRYFFWLMGKYLIHRDVRVMDLTLLMMLEDLYKFRWVILMESSRKTKSNASCQVRFATYQWTGSYQNTWSYHWNGTIQPPLTLGLYSDSWIEAVTVLCCSSAMFTLFFSPYNPFHPFYPGKV